MHRTHRFPWLLLALPSVVACGAPEPPQFSVVTYNTGTTEGLPHDDDVDDGYTSEEAAISDQYYGDGLAWPPAIDAARAFFAEDPPALVGFQEMFWGGDCANIPAEQRVGWFCETWSEGDATVAQEVLGAEYQLACHPGKNDKCVAVHRDFGHFGDCEDAVCPDVMEGAEVEGCGSGARVAWVDVNRPGDTRLRLISVHGSSGLTTEDKACRTAQFEAAFAAVELPTILLGDLNTDPGRWTDLDESAAAFSAAVEAASLHFVTEVGEEAEPTYAGVVNIDHVVSDVFVGSCVTHGISEGTAPVYEPVYFDHHPVRCELQ
ncbi:MAG: hypothetical protein EP330_23020 [Deltaproteobacteria bacterium]|nr:MAG: hypothetical protein EP330_23020 [Deltaproteobacteria bacterium]